ncbi:MAG: hypothetical protein ACPGVT_00240 [Maricaulaceae bacterium]
MLYAVFLPAQAFANDNPNGSLSSPSIIAPVPSLDRGLGPRASGGGIDIGKMPIDLIGNGGVILDLNTDTLSCFGAEDICLARQEKPLAVEFSTRIKKANPDGLDLEVVPNAGMSFDEGAKSAALGAVVRIGDDLRGRNVASNSWYVFAGANAEAHDYSSENTSRLSQGEFGFQNRVIVGDTKAGIGYRIGDADVSLGYFHREINSYDEAPGLDNFSSSENTAALSFTWRK